MIQFHVGIILLFSTLFSVESFAKDVFTIDKEFKFPLLEIKGSPGGPAEEIFNLFKKAAKKPNVRTWRAGSDSGLQYEHVPGFVGFEQGPPFVPLVYYLNQESYKTHYRFKPPLKAEKHLHEGSEPQFIFRFDDWYNYEIARTRNGVMFGKDHAEILFQVLAQAQAKDGVPSKSLKTVRSQFVRCRARQDTYTCKIYYNPIGSRDLERISY